jgi:mono/diheme cytochrome c family protein
MRWIAVLTLAAGIATPLPALADAESLWKTQCVSCHGEDGRSDTPAGKATKAPNLTQPGIAGRNGAALEKAILGATAHKALAGKLSKEEVGLLAAFVQGLGH